MNINALIILVSLIRYRNSVNFPYRASPALYNNFCNDQAYSCPRGDSISRNNGVSLKPLKYYGDVIPRDSKGSNGSLLGLVITSFL